MHILVLAIWFHLWNYNTQSTWICNWDASQSSTRQQDKSRPNFSCVHCTH